MSQFFEYLCRIITTVFMIAVCGFSSAFAAPSSYNTNGCLTDVETDCDSTRRQCVATVSGKVFTGWWTAASGGTYIEDLSAYNSVAYAHCETGKFAVAIKTPTNKQFSFKRSFTGDLDIDWGDGSTTTSTAGGSWAVSASHTYADANTVYVIVLTGANVTTYAGYSSYSTLLFDTTQTAILNIYGSLGALFPSDTSLSANNQSPRFPSAFASATNLVGPLPPDLFKGITVKVSSMFATTFNGCSNLSGYLPPNIFDSSLSTDAQSYSNNIFNGTALVTSCPADTYEVATSIQKSWLNSKVACEKCPLHATSAAGSTAKSDCSCPANSALNNAETECVCNSGYTWDGTACSSSGSACNQCSDTGLNYLKFNNGLSIPICRDKTTTPAINIKHGNTVCYIPLSTSAAPANSLRINHNGTQYYAVGVAQ